MPVKEKKCKNCQNPIQIEYDGSQSANAACNRKYCSIECGREYRKKHRTGHSIELTCIHCGKTYHKPKSQSKNSKFCSRKCQNTSYAAVASKQEERKCQKCGKKYNIASTSRRKYCSVACSSLGRRKAKRARKCKICKQAIKGEGKKFCSRACQYEGQSLGLVKSHSGGRAGYRRDLPKVRFRSSLEADYMRYCQHTSVRVEYAPKAFHIVIDGKDRRYTPDFYLPDADQYIEVKALRKDGLYDRNLACVKKLQEMGYNVTLVSMKEFYQMLRSTGFYDTIPNLENRDYRGTLELIYS